MALDAGVITYQMPAINATTSATPAVSLPVVFTGTGIIGGFYINENMVLEEFGLTASVAGTTTAIVMKLQLCRDTQIGNAADIVGIAPPGSATTSALLTAPSVTLAVGTTLVKRYNFQLAKGDIVLINQTVAATAAKGFTYMKGYPSGETTLPTKLQATTVISTLLSTT